MKDKKELKGLVGTIRTIIVNNDNETLDMRFKTNKEFVKELEQINDK